MALHLPADLEPFADSLDVMHDPGVYCLDLTRPDDFAAAWDRAYDHRPPWFDQAHTADRCIYIGAASDVLHRLEDHRDGEVRQATLVSVCSIASLRGVWWADAYDQAEVDEYNIAAMYRREHSDWYVHRR